MPYRYLEELAIADVAFEATGRTLEELFVAAADATTNVMVGDLASIADRERRTIRVEDEAPDMLLLDLLQELLYYKDAERLLLRVPEVHIKSTDGGLTLAAEAYGEQLDAEKHVLLVDVKAVTMHHFEVTQTEDGWRATVVLDI